MQTEYTTSTNRSSNGAAAELVAAADLLRRGYHVFRSLSPSCPCDLVVLIDGHCYQVEVKTASHVTKNGRICVTVPRTSDGKYHIVAAVIDGRDVVYIPSMPGEPEYRIDKSVYDRIVLTSAQSPK